ncbi:MAG: DUF1302 domain-containing protein, partial [Salinisphaera sp.]|nr:DUF1302 domain-containing protein [Salinisphaera sp.]
APDDAIPLPFGKTPDDPNQLETPANDTVALVTDTSFAIARGPNREPSDGGQYGIHLDWFIKGIGETGMDLGFYYANYHSRIPVASATATAASCARREGNPLGIDPTNVVTFFAACGINPGFVTEGGTLTQRNALPLDTASYFIEYPEDIHVFGLSYSTLIGGWAWQGEVAYRPNLPVQVDLEDLFFAAFQPSFPRNTIVIIPDALDTIAPSTLCGALPVPLPVNCNDIAQTLTGLAHLPTLAEAGGATLADSEFAIPDFVTAYRGGVPGEVKPHQYIRGYERLDNITTSFNFTKLLGGDDAPLGADQFIFLFDLATSWLPDLPSTDEIQFEALGTFFHASPGIKETDNALKINPRQSNGNYVEAFTWGYRAAVLLAYQNLLWPGSVLVPTIALLHGVDGPSPGLAANFVEGRKILFLDLELQSGHWSFNATQTIIAGGGQANILRDRDNLSLSLSYEF